MDGSSLPATQTKHPDTGVSSVCLWVTTTGTIMSRYRVDHDNRRFERPTMCRSMHHGGHHLLGQHLTHGCHKQTANCVMKLERENERLFEKWQGQPHRLQERQACAGRHRVLTLVLNRITTGTCDVKSKRPGRGGLLTAQLARRAWKRTPYGRTKSETCTCPFYTLLERHYIRPATYVHQAGHQRSCRRPSWPAPSLLLR